MNNSDEDKLFKDFLAALKPADVEEIIENNSGGKNKKSTRSSKIKCKCADRALEQLGLPILLLPESLPAGNKHIVTRYRSWHYIRTAAQAYKKLQEISQNHFDGEPICLELDGAGRTSNNIYFMQFALELSGARRASAGEFLARNEICRRREYELRDVWKKNLRGMGTKSPFFIFYVHNATQQIFPVFSQLKCLAVNKTSRALETLDWRQKDKMKIIYE